MKAEKDPKTGKWLIQYRYRDWTGANKKSTKRGFKTKREAEEWVRNFLMTQTHSLDMKFSDFVELYFADMRNRLREHTIINKEYVVRDKLIPYFGRKKMNEIGVPEIRAWQNELIQKGYAPTYLKSINNQLSAIFNYAVRYYDLSGNPCRKAGSMGRSKADEMQIWTKAEYQKFSDCLMDKHISWIAFQILFWTGIRIGELMALTFEDVNLDSKIISINKSFQRLKGKDVVTAPKTPKSVRTVNIPAFLAEDILDYQECLFDPQPTDRLIPVNKSFLEREMARGVKLSGVKKIRIHDLRHSHVSLLIELGFSPKEIAERLGHENIETTLNTYSHLYPNKQERMADRLDRFYQEENENREAAQ